MWQIFYILYKSGIKTFLKWSINICSKGTHNQTIVKKKMLVPQNLKKKRKRKKKKKGILVGCKVEEGLKYPIVTG